VSITLVNSFIVHYRLFTYSSV